MKVVLVTYRDDERKEFPLRPGKTLLGRQDSCQLRIPTGDVSRKHCEIEVSDSNVKVRDLGSTNGTFVNGQRTGETALKAGDRLGIGPVLFVVQVDGKPASITPADVNVRPVKPSKPAPAVSATEETDEVLDLDDLELELDNLLSEDEDEDDLPPKGKK